MEKAFLYFAIAALTSALAQPDQPQTAWEWGRFLGISFSAGFVALKALDSSPAEADPAPPKPPHGYTK